MPKENDTSSILAAAKKIMTGRPAPGLPIRKIIGKPAKRRRGNPWAGGYRSDALGVNPDQIPEARAALRAQGVCVEFDKDGCAIMESERQYKDVARATGMWTGRDGFQVPDGSGGRCHTGREAENERKNLEKAIDRACEI